MKEEINLITNGSVNITTKKLKIK